MKTKICDYKNCKYQHLNPEIAPVLFLFAAQSGYKEPCRDCEHNQLNEPTEQLKENYNDNTN